MFGWLYYVVPFIVLLGILVSVHESGHFLVAKAFGITVERYSIGFGPPIVSWKRGGTEYRLAWIPLGGYVKMAGDDPTDDSARLIPGSFLGAKLWKRMLVVLAGPGVNLVLPIFLFAGWFMYGRPFAAAWVGGVTSNTPAAEAGLEAGDRILSINGTAVHKWADMTDLIRAKQAPVTVLVERDGQQKTFTLTPLIREQEDEFGIKTPMPVIGVMQVSEGTDVDPQPGSAAEKAGLQPGDHVVAVNGKPLKYRFELERAIAAAPAGKITLDVERRPPLPTDPEAARKAMDQPPQKLTVTIDAPAPSTVASLGLRDAQLTISQIEPDSPAEKAALHAGERIVAVDGKPVADFNDLHTWLDQGDHSKASQVSLEDRDGTRRDVAIAPIQKTEKIPGASKPRQYWSVGVDTWVRYENAPEYVERYLNPVVALWHGVLGTGEVISENVRAFGKMFQGKISVRDSVGGPIAIAQYTGIATREGGLLGFLEVLINMSVILGVMNLLPIPILDGGHLAFFSAEGVLHAMGRNPPSVRVREVAQQAGLLALLAVMAFVIVNDIVNRM